MDATHSEALKLPRPIGFALLLAILGLGGGAVYLPLLVTLVWAVVVCFTFYSFVNSKIEWTWYGIAASPALEVWARMSKAPYIPYECGKYYVLLASFVLLLYHVKNRSFPPVNKVGLPILLFLLPGLLISLQYFDREQWVFNALPVIELAVLLLFISRERWSVDRFAKTIRFGILPIIPVVIFITLRSPSLSGLNFSLRANYETAGSFGTNQVATILGSGIVFTVILLIIKYPLFTFRWMSYVLIGYLSFRGLLTFSRGGMISALLSIVIALVPAMFASVTSFIRGLSFIMGFGLITLVTFTIINNISGNKLLQRYMGETEGTISGNRQKTLNVITSGRSKIMNADIEIFTQNIFAGVGPGRAQDLRSKYGAIEGSAAHTEFTRLLSEHGLGGLAVVLIMTIFPFVWVRRQASGTWRKVVISLFCLAVFSSFHSAMRTNITVVCYAIAAAPIIMNDYWFVRFKQEDN